MFPLTTGRLILREATLADAAFALELLNDPGFRQYIGDRGVRDLSGAEKYLQEGPLAHHALHGYGPVVITRHDGVPVGVCSLLRRDFLPHPDLGYALLARHTRQGYAREAASAMLRHAHAVLGMTTLHAITAFRNPDSVRLLGDLGFVFERFFDQPGHTEPSRLFTWRAPAGAP